MEQSKISIVKFMGMLLIYILLGTLDFFKHIETVLFPFLALPFTLYCMRNKVSIKKQILFHAIVSLVLYALMGNPYCILIYCIAVAIPTYMILFLYQQEFSIPNIMMYIGLGLSVVVFIFFTFMKWVGVDFELQFTKLLTEVNQNFASAVDYAVQVNTSAGLSSTELQQIASQMKQMVAESIATLKVFYPAIIVSQLVMSSAMMIVIFNVIMRCKNKAFPSTKEVLEFRVSKVAVMLLVLCMLSSDSNTGMQESVMVLGLNLMWFLMNLLQVAGTLGLIALLRKTSINGVVKVSGYIAIVFLFIFFPYVTMFFGCLDAIFNYRKVKIVV